MGIMHLTSTARAVDPFTAHAVEHELELLTSFPGVSTTLSRSIPGATTENWIWTSNEASNIHTSLDWPLNGYELDLEITATNVDLGIDIWACRVEAVSQERIPSTDFWITTDSSGTTGLKHYSTTATWSLVNSDSVRTSGDHYAIKLDISNGNMMSAFTFTIKEDDAQSFVTTRLGYQSVTLDSVTNELVVSPPGQMEVILEWTYASGSVPPAEDWRYEYSADGSTGWSTVTSPSSPTVVGTTYSDSVLISGAFEDYYWRVRTGKEQPFTGDPGDPVSNVVRATAPSSGFTVVFPTLAAPSTLYNPEVVYDQNVVLPVLAATSTILNPTVIPPASTVAVELLAAPSTLLDPSVVAGAVTVQFNLLDVSSTIFSPEVIGSQVVEFQSLTTGTTVFNPTVVPPAATVELNVINAPSTIYNPSGVEHIDLPVLDAPSTLYAPTSSADVDFELVAAPSAVFQPVTSAAIALDLLIDDAVIHTPVAHQISPMPVVSVPASILSPTTNQSGATLTVEIPVLSDETTLHAPTSSAMVSIPVLETTPTILNPSLDYLINLEVLETTTQLFAPTFTYVVGFGFVNTAPTVLAPTVTGGESPEPSAANNPTDPYEFPRWFPTGMM